MRGSRVQAPLTCRSSGTTMMDGWAGDTFAFVHQDDVNGLATSFTTTATNSFADPVFIQISLFFINKSTFFKKGNV